MVDYAALVLDIDSGPARTAATDLAKFNQAAVKASAGADKLSKTTRDARGRFISTSDSVAKYGDRVRELADRFNPALSAVYRYQRLQVELNEAVSLGVLTQKQATAQLQSFEAAMRKGVGGAAHHVANLSFQLNDIGMMLLSGQNPFMLMIQQGPQVAQIFSQIKAEGKGIGTALRGAFTMLFNPTTILTLAVIGLGSAFTQWGLGIDSATKKSKSLEDRLDDLKKAVDGVNASNNNFTFSGLEALREKYGEVDSQVLNLIRNQKAYNDMLAEDSLKATLKALGDAAGSRWYDIGLSDHISGVLRLQTTLKTTREDAETLKRAFDLLASATNYRDQVTQLEILARYMRILAQNTEGDARAAALKLLDTINEATSSIKQLAKSAPGREWLSPAISSANELSAALGVSLATAQKIAAMGAGVGPGRGGDPRQYGSGWVSGYDVREADKFLENWKPPKTSTGGGGGGGAALKQAEKQFQSIRELLEQETLFQVAEYEKRQAQLDNALAKQLMSIQQYELMKSQLQTYYFGTEFQKAQLNYQMSLDQLDVFHQQGLIKEEAYQIRLAQLRGDYLNQLQDTNNNVWSVQLDQMAGYFGEMNTLAGGGYDALLKAQRIFGAASALISTYTGAAEALKLPFPYNIAAMGKVLAAGMGLVSAIKSGGSSAKTSASSTSQAAVKQEPTKYMYVKLEGDDWAVSMAESIIEQIYDQSKDGRVIVSRY